MKILISLISYEHLTGAELYVYELAKRYRELGHQVLITAPNVGGEIADRTRALGVEIYSFEECPSRWEPDILHVNEYIPSIFALTLYPKTPAVATVHSQFLVEQPFISDRIYKYICIRPQVQEKLLKEYGMNKNRTAIIYNGVDFKRFSPLELRKKIKKNVLFVGTIDRLRKNAILELIQDAKKNSYNVTIVGKRYEDYLDNPPRHVKILPPVWDVERYLKDATETAGILLGRTTIEGWARGLPGWIYEIDLEGNIVSKVLHQPPDDVQKFNIENVANSILSLYGEAIKNKTSLRFDEMSLAESQALLIAKAVSAEAKLLYQAGAIETLNNIVNQLGQQTHDLRVGLQHANDRIGNNSTEAQALRSDIREVADELRRATRISRAARKYVRKVIPKGSETNRGK